MPANIITTDDLREFKIELLEEIATLLETKNSGVIKKTWLKSTQVMDMLQISPGTLQNLRVNGTLPYTKIGGLIFYDAAEIDKVMMANSIIKKGLVK